MKIRNIRILWGLNMWAYESVLEAIVDLEELKDSPSDELPGFNERLLRWLPSLIEHRCSIGERGGFCQRLERGTYQAHILEHVCLELQSLIGYDVGFGRARETDEEGVYKVVFGFGDDQVATACLYAAQNLLNAAVHDLPYDIKKTLADLRAYDQQVGLTVSERILIDTAKKQGIPYFRIAHSHLLSFGYGKYQKYLWGTLTPQTGAIACDMAGNRAFIPELLRVGGLPVISSYLIKNEKHAWEIAQDLGLPVVIKRRYAQYASGAYLNLNTESEVKEAYHLASADEYSVIIEPFISGKTYHLLVNEGQLLAISCEDNKNLFAVSGEIHYQNIHYAALAAKIVGLKIAHVVMMAKDISESLSVQAGKIIGIHPEINLSYWQTLQSIENFAGAAFMRHIFSDIAGQGRIPVFGISGIEGQNLCARLLHHIFLKQKDNHVGLSCRQGIWIKECCLSDQVSDNALGAQRVLRHPEVDRAILENSWKGIQTQGLGFDHCEFAIITDASLNEAELEEDQRTLIFKNLRSVIDGATEQDKVILSAEETLTTELTEIARAPLYYFSLNKNHPLIQKVKEENHTVFYWENDSVVIESNQEKVGSINLNKVQNLTDIDQKSVLAAITAAWLSLLSIEEIQQAINNFNNWCPSPRLEK